MANSYELENYIILLINGEKYMNNAISKYNSTYI